MNGPQHYREAERIIGGLTLGTHPDGCPILRTDEPAALAAAQVHATLALAAGAEDTRRLGQIRDLLTRFDWEHDDRQCALEQIERITEGESDER